MSATLASIHIYPLKSCSPLALEDAVIGKRGIDHDRRWMAVDATGKFLTGRQYPRLTLIRAEPDDDGLRLSAPDMPELRLLPTATQAARVDVQVWKSRIASLSANAVADAWISTFLGLSARLVYMDSACTRDVDPDFSLAGDEVSFADGYPLLLISQAALVQLNARLARPVPMLRFRPNLVVAGTPPHAEDGWNRVRIGAVEFDVVKPCIRCVFTTVDFEHGRFDASGEPLRTLLTYRRTSKGVSFGQNLIPRRLGTIRTGDTVHVMA
ncbi:MAG: MOSC domain-containing protein [Rudaea sp.]